MKQTIVVDCGARWCRAGFEGDSEVRLRIPTLVGKGKTEDGTEATFVGNKAQKRHETLDSLGSPIVAGLVKDWDAMQHVWEHSFDQLKVEEVSEHPVLLTETALGANKCRERMGELMLEQVGVAGVFIESQPLLAAYAAGRLNCVVTHLGHEYAQTAIVCEGYVLRHLNSLLEVGGRRVTDHLERLLAAAAGSDESSVQDKYGGHQVLEELKEAVCYVAQDYEQETKKAMEGDTIKKSYKLPDGQTVCINEQRFLAPEILFRPYIFGESDEDSGIQANISHSISQSNIDIRKELLSNIVLSGGNSKFDGLQDRLTSELKTLFPGGANVKVSAKVNREDFAFLGGAILSSLGPSFQKMYVTKQQLEESGNKIFQRREI